MMRIGLATTIEDHAPSYHLRFRSVLNALQRQGKVADYSIIRKTFFGKRGRISFEERTDGILIARLRDLGLLKKVFDYAKSRKVPVIYETDDLILYERRSDSPIDGADAVTACLKQAACIIASTSYLAEELKPLNSVVTVFPNLLDPGIWNIPDSIRVHEDGQMKICCIGTGLMAENLSFIIPAMEYCEKKYGTNVIFSLWGNVKYLDERVRKLKNVTLTGKKVPYMKFARELQASSYAFGVVPLSDLRFNRAKSNIKYLEYAVSGIPAIFSQVEAYAAVSDRETCLLVENDPDAWKQGITSMIEDGGLRERLARNAFMQVKDRFILNETWTAQYVSILESCCGR